MSTTIFNTEYILSEVIGIIKDDLQDFLLFGDVETTLNLAFGDNYDRTSTDAILTAWGKGDFSNLPKIEIVSSNILGSANGGFAVSTNTIYLSDRFSKTASADLFRAVIIEEIGHFLDAKVNQIDTQGDEGEIFSNLVRGITLTSSSVSVLQTENDLDTVLINEELVSIEKSTTYTGTNLGELNTGIQQLLSKLQAGVNSQILGANLPLLGTKLNGNPNTQFIQNLQNYFQTVLQGSHLSAISIQQALTNALGASGANVLLENITFNETTDNLEFALRLGKSSTNPLSFTTSTDTNLGLPGIDLSLTGSAQSNLSYDLNFKFGINKTSGFYFRTDQTNEFSVKLDTTLPGLNANAKLGFLKLNAQDAGSKFNGLFAVDLKDGDGKVQLTELPSLNLSSFIDPKLTGAANVKLGLKTAFAQNTNFPTLSSDFTLDWNFNGQTLGTGTTQNFGSLPAVAFKNVELDLGTFLNGYMEPILNRIKTITQPIQPVLDFFTKEYDFEFTKFSILDIAESLGAITQSDKDFIESLAEVGKLVNSVPSSGLAINLGSFNFGTQDIRTGGFNLGNIIPTNITSQDLETQLNSDPQANNFISRLLNMPGGGLSMPILSDPNAAFGLLLGKDVDLFKYKLPRFDFQTEYSQYFPLPIITAVGMRLTGKFGGFIDLGLGFDSKGFRDYQFSDKESDILNGFYIDNPSTPEVGFNMGVEASAELNLGVASAGGGGGIYGDFKFDLNDPDADGKVRFNELASLLSNPQDLFEAKGQITAGFFAYASVGVGYLKTTKRFNLPEFTLAEFNWGKQIPPGLALATLSSGTLYLNVGIRASSRIVGDTTDIAEVFSLKHEAGTATSETIVISGFQFNQTYTNVQQIRADAAEKDDRIILQENILVGAILNGGNGNDVISGGSGQDSISGNNDRDNLQGRGGNDTLRGGSGNDYVLGGLDNDFLYGDGEDDFLDGESGNDRVSGGAGNDMVFGNVGNDSLYGDSNEDELYGDAGADLLDGGTENDVIYGEAGIDTLKGGAGADLLDGDTENDSLYGDAGNDTLKGGVGADLLDGGTENDSLYGDGGIDTLKGGVGADLLDGGTENDVIYGDAGNDLLKGGAGNDLLDGGTENDSLYGDAGNDLLKGGAGNDLLDGGTENDSLYGDGGIDTLKGGVGADLLDGGTENDVIYGDAGNDTLKGGAGNDLLDGGTDYNDLDGGDGVDTVTYINLTRKVIVNIDQTKDYSHTDYRWKALEYVLFSANYFVSSAGLARTDTYDLLNNLENIMGSQFADLLIGNAFDNQIIGQKGNDLIVGNDGNDTLDGGEDIDVVVYGYDPATSVYVNLELNTAIDGYGKTDTLLDIEYAIGSDGDDTLVGNGQDNVLEGEKGNDLIESKIGNDVLYGDDGNDSLYGETGIDTLYGGLGNDLLDGGTENDSLNGYGGNDTLYGGTGVDRLYGNTENDLIYGDDDNDFIYGDAGHDTLKGGEGVDLLDGGTENDFIYGEGGIDTLNGRTGNDWLDGGTENDFIYGNAGNDTLKGGEGVDLLDGGTENDFIYGEGGIDTLKGNVGNDLLDGGTENDSLYGDAGNDTLYGGTGNDLLDGSTENDSLYGDGGIDTLKGNVGNDLLDGGTENDSLYGEGGIDTLKGGTGNDLLDGSTENDSLYGEGGIDTLKGGTGNDLLDGGTENDSLYGEGGIDTLKGGTGNDLLDGGTENDSLYGEGGIDTLKGGTGNDLLDGGTENDSLYGDAGNDTLKGGTGNDLLDGGTENDSLYGEGGIDTLYGGAGNDLLDGGTENDSLYGDAGNDTLKGGLGQDTLIAGAENDRGEGGTEGDYLRGEVGNDTLYGNDGDDVIVGGNEQQPLTFGDNDFLSGGNGNDILKPGWGDDIVDGGDGIDTLILDYSTLPTQAVNWVGYEEGTSNYDAYVSNAYGMLTPIRTSLNTAYSYRTTISADGTTIAVFGYLKTSDTDALGIPGLWVQKINSLEPPVQIMNYRGGDVKLSGDGSKIIWYEQSSVWTANADGTQVKRLTSLSYLDYSFTSGEGEQSTTISADGKTIAWARYKDSKTTIYIANFDGTNQRTIQVDSYVNSLDLSDNGFKITWAINWGGVWVANTDGSNKRELSGDLSAYNLVSSISGDGAIVAWVGTQTGVYAARTDGSQRWLVPNTEKVYSFGIDSLSYDGKRVVLDSSGEGVYVASVDGAEPLTLISSDIFSGGILESPSLSNYADIGVRYNSFNLSTGNGEINTWGPSRVKYSSVEQFNITGTAYGDDLRGGNLDDTLTGGDGGDTLTGGTGNDTYVLKALTGGGSLINDLSGTDKLDLSDINLILGVPSTSGNGMRRAGTTLFIDLNKDGVAGNNDLRIDNFFNATGTSAGSGFIETVDNLVGSNIVANLQIGNDTITGSAEDDLLDGWLGNDQLKALAGNDTLRGQDGNDVLDAGEGNDLLQGGNGNDTLAPGWGDDLVDGGAGTDILVLDYSNLNTRAVAWTTSTRKDNLFTSDSYEYSTFIANAYGLGTPVKLRDSNYNSSDLFALSGDGTTYAYFNTDGYNYDNPEFGLWVGKTDGGSPIKIDNNDYYYSYGISLSSNGNKIAWNSDGIYVANGDGTGKVALPNSSSAYGNFILSGNGNQIAWTNGNTLYVANTNGTNIRKITQNNGENISLSEDGSQIIWQGYQGDKYGVWYANTNVDLPMVKAFRGGNSSEFVSIIHSNGIKAIWADGSYGNFLAVGSVGSSEIQQVAGAYNLSQNFKDYSVLSDDGAKVAFIKLIGYQNPINSQDGLYGLYVADSFLTGTATLVTTVKRDIDENPYALGSSFGITNQLSLSSYVDIGVRYNSFNVSTGTGEINTWGPSRVKYSDVERFNIIGTRYGDDLRGANLGDTLMGGIGNDTITPGLGIDSVDGGVGNDLLVINYSTLTSNITSVIGTTINTIGDGINNIITYSNFEIFNVVTGSGTDKINGGVGDDTINGGSGADTMVGANGNDIYHVDDIGDRVVEALNEGTDFINSSVTYTLSVNIENLILTGTGNINSTGNTLSNLITGNIGNNNLSGGDGNDTLTSGRGNDTLNGGTGGDSMTGGRDNDIYYVDNTGDHVVELSNEGIDTVNSTITYTLGSNIENLTLTGTGNINGTGNTINNLITGNSGNNNLRGGDRNDTLIGGIGNDTLIGDTGNDIYYVDNTGDRVVENSNEGTDTVRSTITYTLGTNVENLVLEGTGNVNGTGNTDNNSITGNNLDNHLTGGDGNDTVNGRGGNDTLTGGIGNDSMIGGIGNDSYYVDSTGDQVLELLSEGADTVRSTITYTLTTNVENLVLEGTANINGTGNTLNNLITGNTGNNNLSGGDGNDTLNGGSGHDTLIGGIANDSMIGGTGNDTYYVDSTDDRILENLTEGTDTVRSTITYNLGTNVEHLILQGTGNINGIGNSLRNNITGNNLDNHLTGGDGNDTLNGGAGNDTLIGELGNDSLIGGSGNDTLIGGIGNDSMIGGIGTDYFRFNSSGEGIDAEGTLRARITDFNVIDDTILIRRDGFSGGLSLGTLPVNQFRVGSSATTSSQRFIYNSSNGAFFFDVDGNGATAAVQFATLNTGLALTNADILVI
ncbi:PD40 domain-containing protein [Geminocystis sp. NIES-3709]|uniref:PD40 domain-containing protein n=1 Tax=Geminocystis sp. NIES-3709 TaxID=1617448 RepID=UPI0005FC8969|nr:PD40 domain-containing protein [Geminocystis sp. NIES-3709]BAQ67006.1 alkaline phosphatase [Geminocystis sp. NIES-3709]